MQAAVSFASVSLTTCNLAGSSQVMPITKTWDRRHQVGGVQSPRMGIAITLKIEI